MTRTTNETPQRALSWARSPLSELLRLAWPMAVSMLSYVVMTLVDTLFVSRMGAAPLAGVGLGGTALWVLICFPFGVLQGAKVLVSQARGAGQHDQVGAYWQGALVWALGLGLATPLLGLGLGQLLPLVTASDLAAVAASDYFHVRLAGVPVVLLFCAAREVRQGLGDTRSPMKASVVANLLNVVLDYLLMVQLEWGVAGAALASVLANVVQAVMLLRVQLRAQPGAQLPGWSHLKALWRMGWPTGSQMLIEMGCYATLTVMVSRYSALHMAAHQVTIQVIHFSFLPALALGEACSVMVGQAVGAGRQDLVRSLARLTLAVGAVYTGLCAVLFAVAGGLIARAFTSEAQLGSLIVTLLAVAAVFQVFDAANIIGRFALRGTGDVRFAALVGVLGSWACTPPAMWLLGYQLGMGVVGGWVGLCVELLVVAALFWWRLERGGWRRASDQAQAQAAARA